jgi:SAM-dependent methyltransferase
MSSAVSPTMDHFADIVTVAGTVCPSCAKPEPRIFYEVSKVPVNEVRLMATYDEAVRCSKGDVHLAFCSGCGFIWNSAFDPALVEYMDDYEATQAFSPTFNAFHKELARYLVDIYSLVGKDVIEIGCGEGEFLLLLKELGVRQATGFDPVARGVLDAPAGVSVIKDWYSEKYAGLQSDLVLSKMVMEHIPDAGRFLKTLRRSLGERQGVAVFAMIPEVTRILKVRAFWDIYYEHCTYYSPGSLARAFRSAGFTVKGLSTKFGSQYVAISAVPAADDAGAPLEEEESPAELAGLVDDFAAHVKLLHLRWRDWIRGERSRNGRVALWGGGSKAVAFLTTLGFSADDIEFVVDINPRRVGTYIAGSGQRIVEPEFLRRYRPDAVVIMNPNYRREIAAQLEGMGLAPRLLSVEDHLAA